MSWKKVNMSAMKSIDDFSICSSSTRMKVSSGFRTWTHSRSFLPFQRFFMIYFRSRRIFARMSDTAYDYTGFYTILLIEMRHQQHEIVTKILSDFWTLYIANVHILTKTTIEKTAILYTYYPYTEHHCEEVRPTLQNYFTNGSFALTDDNMFPEKFRNFHKCPLTLSTYNLVPYMMLTPQPNGSYHTDGIDGVTFRVISQQLNFTPIVRMSAKNLVQKITTSKHESKNHSKLRRSLEMVIF